MEGSPSSSLLTRPPFSVPSPCLSSHSLVIPAIKNHRNRGASLIAKAELPETGAGSSSGDAKNKPAGFGSATETKKKKNIGTERSAVIRRSPVEKPSFLYSASKEEGGFPEGQQGVKESAFLLTWLGLGLLILVEGIMLAASGLLPEEWDNFLVKYLYPSFTPTVFLFVGGTASYGLFKYLQGMRI